MRLKLCVGTRTSRADRCSIKGDKSVGYQRRRRRREELQSEVAVVGREDNQVSCADMELEM